MNTQQLECTHYTNPLAHIPPAPLTTPQDSAWLWQAAYTPVAL